MNNQGHGVDAVVAGVTPPTLFGGPPSAFATSLSGFWAERRRPVRAVTLTGGLLVGVVGGALLVGHRLGLGLALVGVLTSTRSG